MPNLLKPPVKSTMSGFGGGVCVRGRSPRICDFVFPGTGVLLRVAAIGVGGTDEGRSLFAFTFGVACNDGAAFGGGAAFDDAAAFDGSFDGSSPLSSASPSSAAAAAAGAEICGANGAGGGYQPPQG